jgi:hypothetical protein
MLKGRQLIDVTPGGAVSILGLSSRKVLQESAAIFESLGPTTEERAAIDLAEEASITRGCKRGNANASRTCLPCRWAMLMSC